MAKKELIEDLAKTVISEYGLNPSTLKRSCWIVVHEYCNGAKPTEYDIREIDESLYLKLLEYLEKYN